MASQLWDEEEQSNDLPDEEEQSNALPDDYYTLSGCEEAFQVSLMDYEHAKLNRWSYMQYHPGARQPEQATGKGEGGRQPEQAKAKGGSFTTKEGLDVEDDQEKKKLEERRAKAEPASSSQQPASSSQQPAANSQQPEHDVAGQQDEDRTPAASSLQPEHDGGQCSSGRNSLKRQRSTISIDSD